MATRLDLFRGMASQLGELVTFRATQASSGLREFISADQITVPTSALNGRDVWYSSATGTSAANRQTARRVVANNPSSTSITVDADWPALPQPGDTIDLVNWHGYSARYYEYHEKINELIDRVADELAIEVAGETFSFDALSPVIAYPDDWDYVIGAQWSFPQDDEESTLVWRPIFKRQLEFQPWDQQVRVKGAASRNLGTMNIRLLGATKLQPLTSDDQETTVSAPWIKMQGAAELKRQAGLRRGANDIDLTVANMILAEAKELRPQATHQYHAVGGFRWSTH